MKTAYTITYTPREMCGEHGYDWRVVAKDYAYLDGKLVAEGWTRGKKKNAEEDVRETIRNRDALRSAAGLSA